jgi:hypothetical protein
MIGVCRDCGIAFETTQEDAGDPNCRCSRCYRIERETKAFVLECCDTTNDYAEAQRIRANLATRENTMTKKPIKIDPFPSGDWVTVVRLDSKLYLVTADQDGSIPINSRILARLEECTTEKADWIAYLINQGLEP